MANTSSTLSINVDVLKQMAKIAATEVEGVAGIAKKNIDLKGALKSKTPFAGIKVETVNGSLEIGVYITVTKEANVKAVAEKVQENVKQKIQDMTGTAVTKVNVIIADIKLNDDQPQETVVEEE